jgi:hypothetical protein
MSLIDKKVTYTHGHPEQTTSGIVIDKYQKAVSWSTGIGHAFGTSSYYIIRLEDGTIKHVASDRISDVIDNPI